MKKILTLAFVILLAAIAPAHADKNISQFTATTSIGTTALIPYWDTTAPTATATSEIPLSNFASAVFQAGFAVVDTVCSQAGMPAACGNAFGFVKPQWYGGFCDSTWNSNNNFHDDGPGITAALASGYPVYIGHCKIASTVFYQGNNEFMFSDNQALQYDLTLQQQNPTTGSIFLPNNLSAGTENVAISFNGYNSVGLSGINAKCNFNAIGSAVIGTDHAFRSSLTFSFANYFQVGNCGMGVGGPTDSNGVPQNAGGDASCGNYGCNIQLQMHDFIIGNSFWGMRLNNTDGHFSRFFLQSLTEAAIATFNNFGGGSTYSDGRIEFDGFNLASLGTSAAMPVAPKAIVYEDSIFAEFSNIEFDHVYGGAVYEFGQHGSDFAVTNQAINCPDQSSVAGANTVFLVDASYAGSLVINNISHTGGCAGKPAYGLINNSTAASIAISNIGKGFGQTAAFLFNATPTNLAVMGVLGVPNQFIGSKTGLGIGTALPLSQLDVGASGESVGSYAGVIAAPSNGAIVSGNVGIGTNAPTNKVDVNGAASIGYVNTAAPSNGLAVSGNVGIGTSSPLTSMDVRGVASVNGVIVNGAVFTVASGCGTTGTVVGGATAGKFSAGSGTCSPVITGLPTAPNNWICSIKDLTTTSATFLQSASTTTGCTLTGSGVSSSDVLLFDAGKGF